jgi:hypothetical protein
MKIPSKKRPQPYTVCLPSLHKTFFSALDHLEELFLLILDTKTLQHNRAMLLGSYSINMTTWCVCHILGREAKQKYCTLKPLTQCPQ